MPSTYMYCWEVIFWCVFFLLSSSSSSSSLLLLLLGKLTRAGMLPGVECARRRRFHQGGSTDPSSRSRRSSFCLYTSSHESHLSANSMQRSIFNKSLQINGDLTHVAREARERLDERLRTQRALEIKRHNSMGIRRATGMNGIKVGCEGILISPAILANLQREVYCWKNSSGKFKWSKLGSTAPNQDECAVCLEEFKGGDILGNLPCGHRFHWSCVVPWLGNNSNCPCCRTDILS